MNDILELLLIPAAERPSRLEAWLEAAPDRDAAARILAKALSEMEHQPFSAEGSNATTALMAFLDVEKMRFPLDEAADACTDPIVQAELWGHAATSSLIRGELADIPYCYASRAVLANPASESLWGIFTDSLRSDSTGFFEDWPDWQAMAKEGQMPPAIAERGLAAARAAASDWCEEDRENLEALASGTAV
jgi:hypothetical protein